MAYVFSKTIDNQGAVNSFQPTAPTGIAVNDYIVIFAVNSSTTAISGLSSFTELENRTATGWRGGVWYQKVTSIPYTMPTITWGNALGAVITLCVRDADPDTFIDTSSTTMYSSVSDSPLIPSITTGYNNELILRACVKRHSIAPKPLNPTGNIFPIGSAYSNAALSTTTGAMVEVWKDMRPVAGATSAIQLYSTSTTQFVIALAVKNKSGAGIGHKVVGNGIVGWTGSQCSYVATVLGGTATDFYAYKTSLGAINILNCTGGLARTVGSSVASVYDAADIYTFTTVPSGGGLFGLLYTFSAVDFSNIFQMFYRADVDAATSPYYLTMYFEDGDGNWVHIIVYTYAQQQLLGSVKLDLVQIKPSLYTPNSSSGTIVWTNIVKIGIFSYANASRTSKIIRVSDIGVPNTYTIVGGNSSWPITPGALIGVVAGGSDMTPNNGILYGEAQYQFRHAYQIGDGTNTSYWKSEGSSSEYPASTDISYILSALSQDITIYASANDTIDFSGSINRCATQQRLKFHASTSPSASYNFAGSYWSNRKIELVAGITFNGATIASSPIITGSASTLSDCIIKTSISTTSAINLTNGGKCLACQFTKGAESYAIDLTEAGSYDLTGNTYNGYTKPINVSATTGTVTITLANGETLPTYDTAGATVAFAYPDLTATVTGIVAGSRIQIYNETTDTEIANEIVAGTSWSLAYQNGNEFSVGDVVRIRLTYINGVSAKEPYQTSAVAAITGWTFLAEQVTATIYDATAIDGSTCTEFDWVDGVYLDVEIDDPDNATTIQRLGAWYYYYITTEDGIAELFGGIDWELINQIKIITSIVDLKLNNVSATALKLTGGRIYRDDDSTVIDASSNSIHIDYNPVYMVETGVSGLTGDESALLNGISTKASQSSVDVIDGIVDTLLTRIDTTVSSRLASASYTAPDNVSISAIKLKTDLIPASPAATSDIALALATYKTAKKTDILPLY